MLKLQLVQDPEALCLDGTKGSFYFEAGSGSGADKWIVYFQGGGWIGGSTVEATLKNGYSRSQTDLGSSKNLAATSSQGGFFVRNEASNPQFYNWNYVYINYCDGTGHQGYASKPYDVGGKPVYFRGERIVKSILNQFMGELKAASKVLVSGCSAGGLAAFTWTQYIRDILPQSTKVFSAPDSGVF